MDKLKQRKRFMDYRQEREPVVKLDTVSIYGAVNYILRLIKDFIDYVEDIVQWIEDDVYSDITLRVNWLLTTTVEDHTSSDTLTEGEDRSIHTNKGATGAITLTLPTVTHSGIEFTFAVQAAQELRVDPGSATIRDDSGQTSDKYKTANAVGECLKIVSNSDGDWCTISKYGTWTEES